MADRDLLDRPVARERDQVAIEVRPVRLAQRRPDVRRLLPRHPCLVVLGDRRCRAVAAREDESRCPRRRFADLGTRLREPLLALTGRKFGRAARCRLPRQPVRAPSAERFAPLPRSADRRSNRPRHRRPRLAALQKPHRSPPTPLQLHRALMWPHARGATRWGTALSSL